MQEGLDKLTYTIDNLLGNTTVRVRVYKKPQVTVSNTEATKSGVTVEGFVNGEKKTITSGSYADYGKDLTVTLKPTVGYEVADDTGMTAVANSDDRYYTISHVTKDQTVTPVWAEIPKVPLTFSVVDKTPGGEDGTNGTITAVVVRKGLSGYAQSIETSGAEEKTLYAYRDSVVTFISNPDEGYTIGTRKLDGNEQREQIVLHITAEHEKHTVEIQFDRVGEAITYGFDRDETTELATISAKFTAQGSISEENFPSGNRAGSDGSITFTVSNLNAEYRIEGWYVNGVKQAGTGPTHTMEVKQGVGGTSVGTSPAQVSSGSRVVFTAAPGSGYQVKGWYSDASCTQPIVGTQAEQKTYIIPELTGNVSVYVSFEPVPTYEITVDIIGTKQGTVTAAVNSQAADLYGEA